MPDEQVANTEVKETPPAETTPQETTEQPTTDSGTVAKETQEKAVDRFDKHPRFQELNREAKEGKEYRRKYEELVTQQPTTPEPDRYAGMSDTEKQQTDNFIEKFVMPVMRKEMQPFIQSVQTERLNKQLDEAGDFAGTLGINFKERLPEITEFLSRQENRGRLTAKEAFLSMYSDEVINSSKNAGKEAFSKEQRELMEKKKDANMQSQTASPSAVVHSDEMAKQGMSPEQKTMFNIKNAIEAVKKGYKNPKVRV